MTEIGERKEEIIIKEEENKNKLWGKRKYNHMKKINYCND